MVQRSTLVSKKLYRCKYILPHHRVFCHCSRFNTSRNFIRSSVTKNYTDASTMYVKSLAIKLQKISLFPYFTAMPTLYCPLCSLPLPTLALYVTHIRLSHADMPGFRICCTQQGCSRSFTNFRTYRNHIYAYHDFNIDEDSGRTLEHEPGSGGGFHDQESSIGDRFHDQETGSGDDGTDASTIQDIATEESLQRAAALWLLKAREKHRLPLSVVDTMIADFQSLYEIAISSCRHQVEAALLEAGISEDTITSVTVHLSEGSPFTNIFRGLQTQQQQLVYFRRHFGLVVSVTVLKFAV